MTDKKYLENLREPTKEDPLRILMSACLTGITCGFDGTDNGEYPGAQRLLRYDKVKIVKFCPEDFSFGTPRDVCDIHGGTGFDVLDGKARVLTDNGEDWTEGMVAASLKMLELAQREKIEIAVLLDMSAACGSQVISDGSRFAENRIYQAGPGVCAAQLMRNGFKVISQRDFASLEILYSKIDPNHQIDGTKLDHHEIEWYKEYFKVG